MGTGTTEKLQILLIENLFVIFNHTDFSYSVISLFRYESNNKITR